MEAIGPSRFVRKLRLTGSSALALNTVAINALRVVSTVCLTRLLAPDVYGITGVIMSVFYMITMVTELGFQPYVVRHERSDERPSKPPWERQARTRVSCTASSASNTEPSIR